MIEKSLEGALLCGWIRADIVRWVAWEGLGSQPQSISLYFAIHGQTQLVSALGSSIWYLAQRNLDVVLISGLILSVAMDIEVDGGVGPGTTIEACAKAGANMIVSGTGVVKADDPSKAMTTMRKCISDAIHTTSQN